MNLEMWRAMFVPDCVTWRDVETDAEYGFQRYSANEREAPRGNQQYADNITIFACLLIP